MTLKNFQDIFLAIPEYGIDQIIGVFSRTITIAAPTALQGFITQNYTFSTNFNDSCYFQGIFTQNGGTTYNDFGAQTPNLTAPNPFFQSVDVEAYTDASNLYVYVTNYYDVVHSTSSSYTVTFKVYLLAKNSMLYPIEPIETNNIIIYSSENNYQKIFDKGTIAINVASGANGSTGSITHNLGYIPKVKAFFLPSSAPTNVFALNQVISPALGDAPAIYANITTSTLYFSSDQTYFTAPGVTGNIEWRIYYDN